MSLNETEISTLIGLPVRFVHQRDTGPTHVVDEVDLQTGMIGLKDMVGWFGPHLFVHINTSQRQPEMINRDPRYVLLNMDEWDFLTTGIKLPGSGLFASVKRRNPHLEP